MTEYDDFVSVDLMDELRDNLLMGGLGLTGEAGEVADDIKKFIFHKKGTIGDFRIRMLEELGDQHWYWTLLRLVLDFSQEEIEDYNMCKLRARYPERHPE